jgi:hypothetical protein
MIKTREIMTTTQMQITQEINQQIAEIILVPAAIRQNQEIILDPEIAEIILDPAVIR